MSRKIRTDECVECYDNNRQSLLLQAQEDAQNRCVPPPGMIKGVHPSDQVWPRCFAYPKVIVMESDVHDFLVSFHLARWVRWDEQAVASQIMAFRSQTVSDSDIPTAVGKLANELSRHIKGDKERLQTSAATKIAFSTKPSLDFYIRDQHAKRATEFRAWRRACGDLAPVRAIGGSYEAYHASCGTILEEERQKSDFIAAVETFHDFLVRVGGPMADPTILDSSFIERYFLDKLMWHEGRWLKDFQEGGGPN